MFCVIIIIYKVKTLHNRYNILLSYFLSYLYNTKEKNKNRIYNT